MALPVVIGFKAEEAGRLLNELEYMARTTHVTEDVHALIRRLRKSLSDSGNGPAGSPATGGLAGRAVPGER